MGRVGSVRGRLCSRRVTGVPLRKLTRPLPTKDGGTLRRVLDARAYMLRLSKDRERSARWQRAAQLLLAKADVGAISRQLELAMGRYATSAKIYTNMAGGQ